MGGKDDSQDLYSVRRDEGSNESVLRISSVRQNSERVLQGLYEQGIE